MAVPSDEVIREMIRKAEGMLARSYTPYSSFKVGAALLTEEGKIYGGCNIENVAYTPTNCAERTAFFTAVANGEKRFSAIAIVGGRDGVITDYCPPCGVCRQVMMEFCDPEDFRVITARSENEWKICTLAECLPEGFGPTRIGF